MKLIPVLGLAAILGVFMTFDKLSLHWYAPDTDSGPVAERGTQRAGTSSPSTTSPVTPAAVSDRVPTPAIAPEIRDAFLALWVAGQRATYRVRYDTRSADGAAGDSYVVFNLPPMARVDTVAPDEREPSSQLIVDATGATLACSPGPSGRSCAPIKPFEAALPLAAGPIVFPAPDTFPKLAVVEVFPRAIAGVAARCFQTSSGDVEAASSEYCFSIDGVPVYADGPFGVVEASEISSDVSADEFQTP